MKQSIFTQKSFPELYNSLPEVELSEFKVKTLQEKVKKFLTEVAELAKRYEFSDKIGVTLVHIHNHLPSPEIVMQRSYTEINGEKKMITEPKPNSDKAKPASWWIELDNAGNYVYFPLEWSADKETEEIFELLQKSNFPTEFADLLIKYELQDILGLTIDWAGKLIKSEDKILVETTSHKDGNFEANTVQEVDKNLFSSDQLVTTNWFFNGEILEGRCCRDCAQYQTFCVPRAPGHSLVTRCVATAHFQCTPS